MFVSFCVIKWKCIKFYPKFLIDSISGLKKLSMNLGHQVFENLFILFSLLAVIFKLIKIVLN